MDQLSFAQKAAGIATAIIAAKMLVTAGCQGKSRFAAGERPPEDASLAPKVKVKQSFGLSKEGVKQEHIDTAARWTRIVQNDLETIPIGLIAAWGFASITSAPNVHGYACLIFAGARVLHTVTYALALQPHRALAWFAGWIAVLTMIGAAVPNLIA